MLMTRRTLFFVLAVGLAPSSLAQLDAFRYDANLVPVERVYQ